MGLIALWHVGSSQTRAQTHVPCIGRWILNHCATRETPIISLNKLSALFFFSSPSGTPICICWLSWWCLISPIGFLHSFSFFLFLWLGNIKGFVLEFIDSFFCCWSSLLNFLVQLLVLQFQNFCLVLFYDFYLFVELLILFMYCFSDFIYFSIYIPL